MNVLIGCEESQTVCKAFRERGHYAFSCDLLPCSGGKPTWHIQEDVLKLLTHKEWDLKICFPPCDHLSVSGARWFKEKRKDGRQWAGIKFFLDVWNLSDAVENPIGIMNTGNYVKKHFPDLYKYGSDIGFPWKTPQIIQPYQFGHPETKATCLWLRGLPELVETKNVYNEMMKLPYGQRAKVHHASPGPERAKIRSKTYSGIAEAMANTWG